MRKQIISKKLYWKKSYYSVAVEVTFKIKKYSYTWKIYVSSKLLFCLKGPCDLSGPVKTQI